MNGLPEEEEGSRCENASPYTITLEGYNAYRCKETTQLTWSPVFGKYLCPTCLHFLSDQEAIKIDGAVEKAGVISYD